MTNHFINLAIACFVLCLLTRCDSVKQNNQVTDIDGNAYRTIAIGNKVWMAENLRTTRYRNGDLITHIQDAAAWGASTSGAYCHYNKDTGHIVTDGRLYNWYAINDKKNIAPEGWHIPTEEEITALVSWFEKDTASAKIFKVHALAGYRSIDGGTFHTRRFNGYWWSATRSFEMYDWSTRLFTGFADIQRNGYEAGYGLAVRCVKD
jgi:hypothetical protein